LATVPKRSGASSVRCVLTMRICAFLCIAIQAGSFPLHAQKAEKLAQMKTLYVDALGESKRSIDLRDRLVRRLEHSHEIQITTDSAKADAVLKGNGQIWSVGEISLSPHSHSANTPVLEGYLSVEVVGKGDQTLWSYLATPSKFPWGGIAEDLARQIASKLLEDRRTKAPSGELVSSGSEPAAGATLKGAGATFPAPLYRKWFQQFAEQRPEVHVSYDAVGSGEGIRRISEEQVDFGASEMPLSEKALAETKNRFVQIPVVLGAVVPIFNLPDVRHPINFTPQILADIYLGKIRKWNNPQIKAANREASLPDAEIVVVHRSDASGTTFVFTKHLSTVSEEWAKGPGQGLTVKWPESDKIVAAPKNDGVTATIRQTPGAIGYIEYGYAIQSKVRMALLQNKAGKFVAPSAQSGSAALSHVKLPADMRAWLPDPEGEQSYPIATYTWMLFYKKYQDPKKAAALRDMVAYCLRDGQKIADKMGYVPLPGNVVQEVLEASTNIQ